jgi:hypothetical protein
MPHSLSQDASLDFLLTTMTDTMGDVILWDMHASNRLPRFASIKLRDHLPVLH